MPSTLVSKKGPGRELLQGGGLRPAGVLAAGRLGPAPAVSDGRRNPILHHEYNGNQRRQLLVQRTMAQGITMWTRARDERSGELLQRRDQSLFAFRSVGM